MQEEDMKSILDAARKLGETAQSAQKPGADPSKSNACTDEAGSISIRGLMRAHVYRHK